MGEGVAHAPPAGEIGDEVAQRAAGLCGQLVGVEDSRGGGGEGDAVGAGELVDFCQRLVAQAALGRVDDAFEGEIVGGLGDDAQIGERVADLGALVEAEAADDAIGHADRDEAVLELAGLVLRADEDRGLVDAEAAALEPFDLLADAAGFLGAVPDAEHLDLLALGFLGPQRLAEAAGVVGDHARCGGEDVGRAAVILLEPDHLGAGEILFELEDVLDLRAAPRIDRLVVVADAAQVLALLREQAEPEILDRCWYPDTRPP